MEVSQQLLFFFSALGAFNGLVLSIYLLFFLRPGRLSNRLLGLLLLALSIRIGKSVFFHFDRTLAAEYLQFGLTACFFIGPLLWAYLKASRDGLERIPRSWWFGFVTLAVIILGVGYWRPYAQYPAFWNGETNLIGYGIYNVWSLGILASAYVLWPIFRKGEKWSVIELWWVNVFAGNLIVHLAFRFGAYAGYIAGALSFSLVFYLFILWFVLQRRQAGFLVKERPKYGDRKIEATEAEDLLQRCQTLMETEQPYLDRGFKLVDLAKAVDSTPHQISQLLNDNAGQSFAAFINAYRVKHAQRSILTEDHLTLEAIGEESGFGSKSAFYSAFKEETGTTPARYRKQLLTVTRPQE
ncbi:AraC family transcriptional regulator [Neolewinella agarilytica]|uniref:Transcriptional regulator, AraC family n=1 Tax=Neolewinella agarilytica TaxID=478744 RepID=A0A1H9FCH0_9BACT|nr:helix-turn-helix domain-containing protein [Neolewinella agarilytica]SEQ35607.1 transcriptional regulator, AraC family [Neolewinella agarilytica]